MTGPKDKIRDKLFWSDRSDRLIKRSIMVQSQVQGVNPEGAGRVYSSAVSASHDQVSPTVVRPPLLFIDV